MAFQRHPLQKLESPSRTGSFILHTLGVISFSLSFRHLTTYPTPVGAGYGSHWQFLTIIGLTISAMSFAAGLIADLTLSPLFFTIKNTLSLSSTPIELLISILYWGLCAIDRSLVVPPDVFLPLHVDIGFHAMPAILLTVDLLLFSPPWTIKALNAMGLSTAFAFAYWAWVEHCYTHNGWYPYPLFAQLNTMQRVILFATSAVLMTACTSLLKLMYAKVNGLGAGPKKSHPANIKGE